MSPMSEMCILMWRILLSPTRNHLHQDLQDLTSHSRHFIHHFTGSHSAAGTRVPACAGAGEPIVIQTPWTREGERERPFAGWRAVRALHAFRQLLASSRRGWTRVDSSWKLDHIKIKCSIRATSSSPPI